ncbi:MAG: CocE/NonD family hydrolase [Pseudomonadales bacterium]|nr:CocE/NonD family hydrolase [Pseudomonadales bacterium]
MKKREFADANVVALFSTCKVIQLTCKHLTLIFTVLLAVTLSSCGGSQSDSNSNSDSKRQSNESAQPVSAPSHVAESDISEQDGDAIEAVSGYTYYRKPDYPNAVNLPLQFITLSSGKKLSVRVTLPADENGDPIASTFPTIVTQSAYNTNLLSYIFTGVPGNLLLGVTDAFIVTRGYAQVAVDTLGTGASQGQWELIGEQEQAGLAEAIDWAQSQPWSNGDIGVAGVSYMAITSLIAAQRRPDAVKAVFASLPMGDAMRGTVGIGGMLNGVFMSNWMSLTHNLSTQNLQTVFANPQHAATLNAATREHIEQIERFHLPMINDALDNDPTYNYDGEFWRTRSPLENIDKIKAPTFLMGALHDIFQRDEPLLYEALKSNGVETRLVVYDGTHLINFIKTHVGNAQVPPVDYLVLQWFDKYLLDMDTRTEEIPDVIQHVKNYPTEDTPAAFRNDSYATTSNWPHPMAYAERWYLHGDGSLTLYPPENKETSPTMENPEHPVGRGFKKGAFLNFELHINDGTECSRSFEQWTLGLQLPQTCHWDSSDTHQQRLVFETEEMLEDYYINGPIQADIWIDSTVTEAVVAVQVEEVSGRRSQPITNGQLLASSRAVNESRSRFMDGEMIQPYHYFTQEWNQPLVPGEVVKMQIEIFPTSALIRKGHKLRISISPSNQAQALLNYPRQAMAEGGITTIHISPDFPSSVVLPVVPTSALN